MNIINMIIITTIVVVALYFIVFKIYPNTQTNDILPNITSLSSKQDIYYSDNTKTQLLQPNGSTIMAFVKLQSGDRTQKIIDGYLPIMKIDGAWYLEMVPAPANDNKATTRLRIIVQNGNSRNEEIVNLPHIPVQKWTFIAILKDGRRYDVIYNNKIVASHRLEYYPTILSSPLSIGNQGLAGSIIHVLINSNRMDPYDIERIRNSYVDTNGNIIENQTIELIKPIGSLLTKCPPGLPCDPITRPPSNKLLQWSTPYA